MAKAIETSKSAEEIVSMFLGLVIVMVVFGLVINFFQKRRGSVSVPGLESSISGTETDDSFDAGKGGADTYVVKKGDNLWKIASNRYNSGYKWVDIAKENDLNSPGLLAVGQELKLSVVETSAVTPVVAGQVEKVEVEMAVEGGEYQVVRGDCLWEVAVRAYGDGYAWTRIWQANERVLNSPDLLEVGMVLAIPRE